MNRAGADPTPALEEWPSRCKGACLTIQESGFVRLVLPAGEPVTEEVASFAASEVARLARGERARVLLELAGVESISREARNVFGSVPNLAAVAVLGAGPVDKVIATFLIGGGIRPPFPTRYFSSEQKAQAWLKDIPSVG